MWQVAYTVGASNKWNASEISAFVMATVLIFNTFHMLMEGKVEHALKEREGSMSQFSESGGSSMSQPFTSTA